MWGSILSTCSHFWLIEERLSWTSYSVHYIDYSPSSSPNPQLLGMTRANTTLGTRSEEGGLHNYDNYGKLTIQIWVKISKFDLATPWQCCHAGIKSTSSSCQKKEDRNSRIEHTTRNCKRIHPSYNDRLSSEGHLLWGCLCCILISTRKGSSWLNPLSLQKNYCSSTHSWHEIALFPKVEEVTQK